LGSAKDFVVLVDDGDVAIFVIGQRYP